MVTHTHDDGEHDIRWMRPRRALWLVVAVVVAGLLLVFAGSHQSGVTMITPGKKPTMAGPTAFNHVVRDLQSVGRPQLRAATRQADANG